MTHKIKIRYRLILLVLISMGAVGCVLISPPYFPFELMLDATVMPKGWLRVRQETVLLVEYNNAESRTRSFSLSGQMDSLINVSQQVSIFEDAESANQAYEQQLTQSFPNENWKMPPEINFIPSDSEDKFEVKCLSITVNSQPISMCP